MESRRIIWFFLLPSTLFLAACSRDEPSAPTSGVHALTGRVRLTGFLTDTSARFVGTRVLHDADGVPVELIAGNRVIAETTTEDGVYRFTGVAPGSYYARTRLIADISDETNQVTVADFDLVVTDTLQLQSRGSLTPAPNPMVTSTRIYFQLDTDGRVTLRILDLAGNIVRNLLDHHAAAGLRSQLWDGRDQNGQLAGNAIYWAILEFDGEIRAHLLFR
jgi:hypothetical protein